MQHQVSRGLHRGELVHKVGGSHGRGCWGCVPAVHDIPGAAGGPQATLQPCLSPGGRPPATLVSTHPQPFEQKLAGLA